MKHFFWTLQNIMRVAFCFAMTAVWISMAFLVLIVTFDRRIPLMMAHYLWSSTILFGVGSKIQVRGLSQLDLNKPYIFVMNHQSTLDIPCIFRAVPVPLRFIVKEELKRVPFLGQYISAMGMIFVNRKDHDAAVSSMRRAGEIIRKGSSVIAYPEGTRSRDGRIQIFKKGIFVLAIEAGVDIVPVAIEGSRHVMPKNELKLYPQTIHMNFGTPIATKGFTRANKEALMDAVRGQMIQLHTEIGGLGGASEIQMPKAHHEKVA